MSPDRSVRTFAPGEVGFTPLRTWTSPRTGVAYPVGMRITLGGRRFDLAPLLDDQELDSRASTGTIYWEGAVRASENGKPAGRGYLELTGYWKPQRV
jgi:predicted secreted hydrolase